MVNKNWHPRAGEIVWINFNPQSGHEQAGYRPALIISASRFNRKSSVVLACPITTKGKGNPFEIALPSGLKTKGFVLSSHVRSVDWKARNAQSVEMALPELLESVRRQIGLILELV